MRLEILRRIQRKELTLFFSSPVAYLFLAAFLAVTLFIFFWIEAYFARNIADVRPMFEWMPVLLIFLSAALTMRMWSEERRTGTLEFVVTMPVSTWEFVVGKFLACWFLLGVALLLTLPIPVTVALIGDLDWGPVLGGYLATILLGGAYVAVGLFVSARTDSQIVSLIVTTFVCGVLYMIGSPMLTELVGGGVADGLRALGSGSRFESIARGVLDLRDLYYYASILLVFLALNVYSLERRRWAKSDTQGKHRNWILGTSLLIANLLIANVWLNSLTGLRVDMTAGQIYSISDATRGYLAQLKEPLLIRGYFSSKTHPLLAPLVPRMKDLLSEFQNAGGSNVSVQVIDPIEDPELEEEANSKYGIRPVPFQVADRYQASLVNSYFDVLISYGDEYEVLSFRDLVEVKVIGEAELDVQLRNPEYDLTRSIKKVLYGFQGGSSVFANMSAPVQFVGYISGADSLPEALLPFRSVIDEVLTDLTQEGEGVFSSEIVDPLAGDGSLARDIAEQYGFQPLSASLFDTTGFYLYLTLTDGKTLVQVPIPEALSAEALKRSLQDGLKRFASGLLRSVALVAPPPPPPYAQQQGAAGNQFNQLSDLLRADFELQTVDLADGVVPDTADLLVVVDPDGMTSKALFAVDQYLMKGGTVVLATGAYSATLSQQSLNATPHTSGLEDWLASNGVEIGAQLVMDPQNSAFPVPVTRQTGGFSFQELVMLDYPYFVDIRPPALNPDAAITSGLPQITLSWASPINLDLDKNQNREVVELLRSSEGSWLSTDTNVMPRLNDIGETGVAPVGEQRSALLGVMLTGRFDSFFAGQPSPLLEEDTDDTIDPEDPEQVDEAAADDGIGVVTSVIQRSPESARLLVFSSNDFLADQTLRMIGSSDGTIYSNSAQMIVNVADYALEDQSLLGIRARGNFNRTLPPLSQTQQSTIEYGNYFLALMGILVVFGFHRYRTRALNARYRVWLGEAA
ncbi:MAG: Gldg family protein [Proteobacteria bacterium]|nr:Gldg family protein [Pseudomonadota bacterium]